MSRAPFDAVMLLAYGGPGRMEDVRPFLENVLRGKPVPRARFEEVVGHYEAIGGRSPLSEITAAQADALSGVLAQRGHRVPVTVGMRFFHPFVTDTLRALKAQGKRRISALLLSVYEADASVGAYERCVAQARAELAPDAPDVQVHYGLGRTPGFITANADALRHTLSDLPEGLRATTKVIFTAHSIPTPMSDESGYAAQHLRCAAAVAEQAGVAEYRLAYQSRSGNPRDPWLTPDILDVLREEATRGTRAVALAPIGFVCDHVEVLYDLDVEAKGLAKDLGLPLFRATAAGTHPAFIASMADLLLSPPST